MASFSSSHTFLCEVMRSEAGQERWNNIIRSLREEQGQIIRLNLAEWKCMGGKVLTLPLVGLIQFPALTPCHRYSSWAVRPRPTNFNICHRRSKIYHLAVGMDEYGGSGVWERGNCIKFKVRKRQLLDPPLCVTFTYSKSRDPCPINTQSNVCSLKQTCMHKQANATEECSITCNSI